MESRSPDELITLALKETSRAVLIGYGRTDVSERGKAVRELDLDQAAANLQLAFARDSWTSTGSKLTPTRGASCREMM